MSSDGSIVAIGGFLNDDGGNAAGHVRVYEYSSDGYGSSTWSQLGSDIDGEGAGNGSGKVVALSADGSIVAIGNTSNSASTNLINSGSCRVYEYSSGSWTQLGSDIDGENAGDLAGSSVDLSADGSIVAIGAPWYSSPTYDKVGKASVYKYSSGTWSKIGSDIVGTDYYEVAGKSLALSADGNTLILGSPDFDNETGRCRIFTYS